MHISKRWKVVRSHFYYSLHLRMKDFRRNVSLLTQLQRSGYSSSYVDFEAPRAVIELHSEGLETDV